jgi:hypothetical protein
VSKFDKLFKLCDELDRRHVYYELRSVRSGTLTVYANVPGEKWEIEFFPDGTVELERFKSRGVENEPEAMAMVVVALI